MKGQAHIKAFSKALAKALLDFKAAVEKHDRLEAHFQYALACGLISGAALSGGLRKEDALNLLATLDETRTALMSAFGSAPDAPAGLLIKETAADRPRGIHSQTVQLPME